MRLKSQFTLREIAGDYIVIPTGNNYLDFNAVITLNETGAFLWRTLEKDITPEGLADALCSEYEVSREEASADVTSFLELLKSHELILNE